mmetsp:Transcript_8453/g.26835  ORF Transcript_8453/g.26835 Transcript_8453/m.26835 type:complete len:216 (-) Transcript_8453:4156-4803(-)
MAVVLAAPVAVVKERVYTNRAGDLVEHACIQVGPHCNAAGLHLLDKLVRLVHIAGLEVVLDQERKDVAHADRRTHLGVCQERVADALRLLRVAANQLLGLNEALHKGYALLQRHEHLFLERLVLDLANVLDRFLEGPKRLGIFAVLVNLVLRAGIVKACQLLVRLRLAVKADDGLHDLGVVSPVQILQIVGSQDVDLTAARHAREENNLVRAPGA